MKSAELLLVAVVAAVSAIPANGQAKSPDEAKIEALVAAEAAAVNAKDVSAIMKAYVPDESLIVFDIIPPRQYVGAKAFRKDWDDFLGGTTGPLKYDITDVNVTAIGSIAYGHSIQRIVATGIKGDSVDLTTRVTDVYRKIKGNWVIVQEHISIPVDLDTGKPDFASKP